MDSHNDTQDEAEFSVTNLRPPRPRSTQKRPMRLDAGRWRWVAVAVSLVIALAVVLSSAPTTHDALEQLAGLVFPTPTSNIQLISRVSGGQISIGDIELTPAPLPAASATPQLGRAPMSCPQQAAKLETIGPGPGKAIGGPSVWVGGFTGAYPRLSLQHEGQQSNSPFGWRLRYTQYGWPAAITLILAPTVKTTVNVTGVDPQSREPLWFGFAAIDGTGAPISVATGLSLNLSRPEIPSSGNDTKSTFWRAYIFLPHAGCYQLYIDIPTPFYSWQTMISAGR